MYMESENVNIKKNSNTFFMVLVILLLLIITISSVISTYYIFSINLKLSVLPKMDFSGIQNSLKEIGNHLDIGVLDIFR